LGGFAVAVGEGVNGSGREYGEPWLMVRPVAKSGNLANISKFASASIPSQNRTWEPVID
jgi:hypothetical protein